MRAACSHATTITVACKRAAAHPLPHSPTPTPTHPPTHTPTHHSQILGAETDAFDAPDFDVVDYVNKHFPDDKSLGGLDPQVAAMEAEIRELDNSILGACVRGRGGAGGRILPQMQGGVRGWGRWWGGGIRDVTCRWAR